jgi:hypothetical protein
LSALFEIVLVINCLSQDPHPHPNVVWSVRLPEGDALKFVSVGKYIKKNFNKKING